MNNMFRLKKELIWNLTDTHIEVFCNNRVLTTEISTEDDRKVFNFLTFLSAGGKRMLKYIKKQWKEGLALYFVILIATIAKVATGILTVYAFDALVQMDY
nr:MAG TPA: hypothetical protein [Caudoviricetes sp.]